jgi:hypothetical protein
MRHLLLILVLLHSLVTSAFALHSAEHSVAFRSVSCTTYDIADSSTTALRTVAKHTEAAGAAGLYETTLRSAANDQSWSLLATIRILNAPKWTPRTPPPLAQTGDDLFVGTYSQVRRAIINAGLNATHTPHHVLQNAVSQTTHGRGITINLNKDLHALTRTFRRPVESGLSLRTHLARDVKDLRRILGDAGYDPAVINRQLQELIRQNKAVGGLAKP